MRGSQRIRLRSSSKFETDSNQSLLNKLGCLGWFGNPDLLMARKTFRAWKESSKVWLDVSTTASCTAISVRSPE